MVSLPQVRCDFSLFLQRLQKRFPHKEQRPLAAAKNYVAVWSSCPSWTQSHASLCWKAISDTHMPEGLLLHGNLPVLGEGRLNRMCVQSSLCQLWQDLHRRNWKKVWRQITGTQDWSGIQNRTHIHWKPSCIKFNRTQQIRSHRQRNSREPCHQLVSGDGDRQRATAFYQMDQKSHTHPKGRTISYESWWGQLPTESRIRPLSWNGVFL